MRQALGEWIEKPIIRNSILALIIINAIVLGLETAPSIYGKFGPTLKTIDTICLAIFVAELVIKLYAQGLGFFKKSWNIFDFVIIGISLAPTSEGLTVLRALRVLRVLRVISFAPSLRKVVEGLVRALPGMGSVCLLMALIFYIGAVMATKLFSASFPDWFGTIGLSAYSLFQIMTLESWSMGIVRPVMEVYPYAWAFFVPFILVTTFAVVNLIIGLVVNSMQEDSAEDHAQTDIYRDEVLAKLSEVSERLKKLEKR